MPMMTLKKNLQTFFMLRCPDVITFRGCVCRIIHTFETVEETRSPFKDENGNWYPQYYRHLFLS